MNTLVAPFFARTWYSAPLGQRYKDEIHPVKNLLSCVQTQARCNRAFIMDGDNSQTPKVSPISSQVNIQPVGRGSNVLDGVRECVLIKHRGRQVLGAVRTAEHRLHLFSWRINADGVVLDTGATGPQAENVVQVEMTKAGKFVVACRTRKQIQLSSWHATNTGAIYRAGEHQIQGEQISKVKLLGLGDALFITALRTRQRLLRLTTWRLAPDERFVQVDETELDGAPRQAFAMLSLPAQNEGRLAIVAQCTAGGQLQLQCWRVSAKGVFTQAGQETLYGVCGVQLQVVADPYGHLITATRTATGHLRMMSWEVGQDGASIRLLSDTGEMGERIRHQALMYGPNGVLTALNTGDGRLKLTAWRMDPLGRFHHIAENTSLLSSSGPVSLCPELLDGNAPILIGIPASKQGIQLTTWHV